MADSREQTQRAKVPNASQQLDGRADARHAKQNGFDAAPLVEREYVLRNRNNEERVLRDLVPLGLSENEVIKLMVERTGGSCRIEPGTGELSEFTWIKYIELSDGFKMEDWIQIRNRNGEFEIGAVDGTSFWENGDTLKVLGPGKRVVSEDVNVTADLPDTQKLIDMKTDKKDKNGQRDEQKAVCGACGADVTAESLSAAELAAKFNIKRETYTVNLDTGRVRKEEALEVLDFVYKPDVFLGYSIAVTDPRHVAEHTTHDPRPDDPKPFGAAVEVMATNTFARTLHMALLQGAFDKTHHHESSDGFCACDYCVAVSMIQAFAVDSIGTQRLDNAPVQTAIPRFDAIATEERIMPARAPRINDDRTETVFVAGKTKTIAVEKYAGYEEPRTANDAPKGGRKLVHNAMRNAIAAQTSVGTAKALKRAKTQTEITNTVNGLNARDNETEKTKSRKGAPKTPISDNMPAGRKGAKPKTAGKNEKRLMDERKKANEKKKTEEKRAGEKLAKDKKTPAARRFEKQVSKATKSTRTPKATVLSEELKAKAKKDAKKELRTFKAKAEEIRKNNVKPAEITKEMAAPKDRTRKKTNAAKTDAGATARTEETARAPKIQKIKAREERAAKAKRAVDETKHAAKTTGQKPKTQKTAAKLMETMIKPATAATAAKQAKKAKKEADADKQKDKAEKRKTRHRHEYLVSYAETVMSKHGVHGAKQATSSFLFASPSID